jgi:hypothetical protein
MRSSRRACAAFLVLLGGCALEPQDLPWEPLSLEAPIGMATRMQLAALRNDPGQCFALLQSSAIAYGEIVSAPRTPPFRSKTR